MDAVYWEWLSLLFRWLHGIASIAWIGSSFYFMHLDASLQKGATLPSGASGDVWQIHGGGFYHMTKYKVAPATLPSELIWHKWEAYTTWISGFFLLVIVYYRGADLFLIDPAIAALSSTTAIAVSLGTLALGWVVYDLLCRSPLGKHEAWLAIVIFLLLVGTAYGLAHLFSGRGMMLQTGAIIGTIMVANVFRVIIPNQRKVVAALLNGRTPDASLGQKAKQRSVHNNYLTLPVLFLMLSNHYPLAFEAKYNWALVALLLVVGASIRYFFNISHQRLPVPWWTWALAAAGVAAMVWLSIPAAVSDQLGAGSGPANSTEIASAEDVVLSRCSMCHAQTPVWQGIVAPPHGVRLDTPETIRRNAELISLYAGITKAMPPANVTGMTQEERQLLTNWAAALERDSK